MRDKVEEIQQKIRVAFEKLSFDEATHSYFVDGNRLGSVSKQIEKVVEKVDFDTISVFCAAKEDVPVETIRKRWKDENTKSVVKGHRVHSFAETEMLNPELPEEHAALMFHQTLDKERYKIVDKEIRMYYLDYHKLPLAGTADLLLYDTLTDTLVICDYKTNKDLFKNYKGKTLLSPFETLLEHPYNKYQIQFTLYQILVEQIGIKVSERWLIYLNKEGEYQVFKTYDLLETALSWLNLN